LYSHVGQATLTSVAESFQSFKALRKLSLAGELNQNPRLPNYRTKDGLNLISFPSADVKLKSDGLRFSLGSKVKAWFKLDAFYLPMPSNIDYKSIREYRILPRNGCFYLELVYKVEPIQSDVDSNRVLGIDHGINNWLTCLSNAGTSFIVDGLHLKSLNQFYNKQVKRGLYRTANNQYINADCNGAGNIIRKVAATLGLCLEGVSSGALVRLELVA